MRHFWSYALMAWSCLPGCHPGGGPGRIETSPSVPPTITGGVPPRIRKSGGVADPPPPSQGPVELTPEDEIYFTNPDNPEAQIPELAALLESAEPRRNRGPWEHSEQIARKRSMREGKPMLIWFTDSMRSPMCKALSRELLKDPAFDQWAEEHVIRLQVDSHIQTDGDGLSLDEKETRLVDIRNYVERLRKQYKILGNPNLVLVHPDGSVIGRYRGYQLGGAKVKWGELKQGLAVFRNSYDGWRQGMERRGYRTWTDRKDRKVFARLLRYHQGTLTLIEPDGMRSKTHENRLCDEDRAWLAEQKKLRGL